MSLQQPLHRELIKVLNLVLIHLKSWEIGCKSDISSDKNTCVTNDIKHGCVPVKCPSRRRDRVAVSQTTPGRWRRSSWMAPCLTGAIKIIHICRHISPVEKVPVHHGLTRRFLHGLSNVLHAALQTRVRRIKAGSLQGLNTAMEVRDRGFVY